MMFHTMYDSLNAFSTCELSGDMSISA